MPPSPPHTSHDEPYPELDRVHAPDAAIASSDQRMQKRSIPIPHGFETPRILDGHLRDSTMPRKDSAPWFKEMYAGFISAQFIQYCVDMQQFLYMAEAENRELRAAHKKQPGVDDSLDPRTLGVWVVMPSHSALSPLGALTLDAMAHWARHNANGITVSHAIRLSVATGSTHQAFDKRCFSETTKPPIPEAIFELRVYVRWCDDRGNLHTEHANIVSVPLLSDVIVSRVQQEVVLLCARYNIAFPKQLVHPVTLPVPSNAYYKEHIAANDAFRAWTEADPHLSLDAAASHAMAAPLESTGVVLRAVVKRTESTAHTTFHGMLLSFGRSKELACAFAHEHKQTGLVPPTGAQEESMGLHICATHVDRKFLGKRVSLFGCVGIAGEAINSPQSWVWCQNPAIRPIDASLLQFCDVYPCSKSSMMPDNTALHDAYRQHWGNTSKLYLRCGTTVRCPRPPTMNRSFASSGDELDRMTSAMPLAHVVSDVTVEADESYLCAALQINLARGSKRTSLGEAYLHLVESNAPASVTDFCLQAMGTLGLRASLSDMFEFGKKSAVLHTGQDVQTGEVERLRRVTACTLAMLDSNMADDLKHAHKKPRVAPTITNSEHVRRMLSTLGLKRGEYTTIKKAVPATGNKLVEVICSSLRAAAAGRRVDGICQLQIGGHFKDLTEFGNEGWKTEVEKIISRSIANIVMGNALLGIRVFILSTDANASHVRIDRLAVQPSVVESSFDEVLATETPSIIMVQHSEEGKTRVQAVVPAVAS